MEITITPTSKRARERVKQHGSVMLLKKVGKLNGLPAILVESLDKTWRLAPGVPHKWGGWFTESEASWEKAE